MDLRRDSSPAAVVDPLVRLRGDEAALEQGVGAARAAAEAEIGEARREAERLAAEARALAVAERDALRLATEAALQAEAARAEAAVAGAVQALRSAAGERREDAIRRVLAVVLGEAP